MTFLRVNIERKAECSLWTSPCQNASFHTLLLSLNPVWWEMGIGGYGGASHRSPDGKSDSYMVNGHWTSFFFFPSAFNTGQISQPKTEEKKKSLYESKKSSVFFLHYTIFLTSPFHPTLNSININKEHVNCKVDFHHVPKSHLPSNTGPFANGSNLEQRTILKVTRII